MNDFEEFLTSKRYPCEMSILGERLWVRSKGEALQAVNDVEAREEFYLQLGVSDNG